MSLEDGNINAEWLHTYNLRTSVFMQSKSLVCTGILVGGAVGCKFLHNQEYLWTYRETERERKAVNYRKIESSTANMWMANLQWIETK